MNEKRKPKNKRNVRNDRCDSRSARTNRDYTGTRESDTNDPNWYTINDQMLKDYASFSYVWPLGTPIQLDTNSTTPGEFNGNRWYVPGICSIKLMPSLGTTEDANSPANLAMRNLMTQVRQANSGASSNYDANDLMMYCLAAAEAYSFHGWLTRLYSLIRSAAVTNRYFPKALVQANGVDFESLNASLANFRAYINQFAIQCNQLFVPKGMNYFDRKAWMYANYFIDSDSPKAQIYQFVPFGFWRFNALYTDNYKGGRLESFTLQSLSSSLDLDNIKTIGDTIIQPLITNQDIGIMAGDLQKAFGLENRILLGQIDENFMVVPTKDMNVLAQIQNARAFGTINKPTGNRYVYSDVTQDNSIGKGTLVSHTILTGANSMVGEQQSILAGGSVVNQPFETPTPGDTVEATRLIGVLSNQTAKAQVYNLKTKAVVEESGLAISDAGTEVVVSFEITTLSTNGGITTIDLNSVPTCEVTTQNSQGTVQSVEILMKQLCAASAFDYAPTLIPIVSVNDGDSFADHAEGFILDFNTYAVIQPIDIANLHTMALMGLFNVK